MCVQVGRRKFRRISKSKNLVARNIAIRNFVVLIRIKSSDTDIIRIIQLLFSAHISYGKGKYLNQTGFFFTKFAKILFTFKFKGVTHRIQPT